MTEQQRDLQWFEHNRAKLAAEHKGRWLVVKDGRVIRKASSEEEAIQFAVEEFGINAASVFPATLDDPVPYFGQVRLR